MADERKPKRTTMRRTPKPRLPFEEQVNAKRMELKKLAEALTKTKRGVNAPEDVPDKIARVAKELKQWQGYQRQLEIALEIAALRNGNTITIPADKLPLMEELDRLRKEA